MPIEIVSKSNNSSEQPRYIPIVEAKIPKESLVRENDSGRIIPSKTLVINELNVTITQNFDEDVDFRIDTKPGILSDNKTIPVLDITAKEDVEFDENLTLPKLESIVRRCGILDTYREFLKINEGFVKVQTTSDVKLPENLKSVDETNMKEIIDGIEKVIENGKLHELFAYAEKVL